MYDKIVKIADAGTITADGLRSGAETVDGTGLVLTPGFVDCHVHVLGGGGEGGFANRTPEATMEGLNKFGVTTVVGCLGTDGIGRDMCALVAKTKGLREQGMSAWCYTGSYQVPVRTLTDGITKDIMMIEEIIGTGEIAVSDQRSSQPTFEEFARLAADTRLGGILSGKAGVINVHLGNGPRCMELIERVISETEIPASQFLPTHVNRNEKLFQKAIEYAVKGGAVDFNGFSMMTRNRGALAADNSSVENSLASYGLYYQWGRKDPFIGPSSYNAANGASASMYNGGGSRGYLRTAASSAERSAAGSASPCSTAS